MEKIKRDNDRVDIAKLDSNDVAGDSLTGGYIIKVDKYTGTGGLDWLSDFPNIGGIIYISNIIIRKQVHCSLSRWIILSILWIVLNML